jgi:hypothetical protein
VSRTSKPRMAQGMAQARLVQERKQWRKDHPHGWIAKPHKNPDESESLLTWDCTILGPEKVKDDLCSGHRQPHVCISESGFCFGASPCCITRG